MDWYQRLSNCLKAKNTSYLQLSTVSKNQLPKVRTVVFRGFKLIDELPHIIITTHIQSNKVKELQSNNNCQLCWWFEEAKEQYRISGTLHLISTPGSSQHSLNIDKDELELLRRKKFDELNPAMKASFSWPQPGASKECIGNSDEEHENVFPTSFDDTMLEKCLENFGLIILQPREVDLVCLKGKHERFLFKSPFPKATTSDWIVEELNP